MGACCCIPPNAVASYEPTSPTTPALPHSDDNPLITMVYVSRMVPGYFEDPKNIDIMIRFAGTTNRTVGLSGYLLVAPPYFLQRLEGPERQLRALVGGIRGDHRHDQFIVVEEKPIARPSYANWSMRSFDLASSAGTKFEAVSFILQSLSRGLAVASKSIPPAYFDALLAGKEVTLQDDVQEALVVTVAFGKTAVHPGPDGKIVADVPLLCAAVDHLRRRLCSLNPEGRGLITVFGGSVLQVAVQMHRGYSLANKVLRACVELATAQGPIPSGNLRVHIGLGKVRVKHLDEGPDQRRGRYAHGPALTQGLEAARALLEGPHPVVLQDAAAKRLVPEFTLQALPKGQHAVVVTPRVSVLRPLSGPGKAVRTCEGALAALAAYRDGRDAALLEELEVKDAEDTGRPASPAETTMNSEDETDLEWMYQLENLSKAHARRMMRRKRVAPKTIPKFRRPPMSPGNRSRVSSVASGGTQLLNIIYMSMMAPESVMSSHEVIELGTKASKFNATMGITGFLLYTEPFFLQYLEGPPRQVKDLFTRIRRDHRHTNVTIIASRLIHDGVRHFADWNMKTTDLDLETAQETAPLREVLRLLSRQFTQLRGWLPRLSHDILLSHITLAPGSYTQCLLVAFAALPTATLRGDATISPMLASLSNFLARGGEIVGFVGESLVGYAFFANLEMLLDEIADLCAEHKVSVGIAAGYMLLVNAGLRQDECDLAFYGPLFDRAQAHAAIASSKGAPIVADRVCETSTPAIAWQKAADSLLIGKVQPQ